MLAMSLVGLGLLSGLDAPPARADFTFGQPVNIQSDFPFLDIATDSVDCFSADGLEMYFDSPRAGGQGNLDIWVSKRASIQDDWGPPENLGATINSASADGGASISADGLSLYSTRDVGPAGRLYVAKRATKQDNWGTDNKLYDIGPYAWGDGKVDIEDLKAFIAQWEKQTPPKQP